MFSAYCHQSLPSVGTKLAPVFSAHLLKNASSSSSSTSSPTMFVRSIFRLSGVYPTVVTPFNASSPDQIDFGRFERLLRHLNRFPIAGYALLGSSGEFASIGYDKKVSLVAHARRYLGDHRIILAGAGLESTDDSISLVKQMASVGADACFVYNPSYFKAQMDTKAYVDHFTKIADSSPVPIILYNVPSHTDADIPIDAVAQLAKHPKIVGLLDAGGNITRIATICMKTTPTACKRTNPFNVIAGSAGFFLPGLLVGCSGAICSLANILPFEMVHLQELFGEGKLAEAQKLQWRFMLPNEAVTTKYGVAGLKAVMKLHLEINTGGVRAPLRNLSPEEERKCLESFHQAGFLKPTNN